MMVLKMMALKMMALKMMALKEEVLDRKLVVAIQVTRQVVEPQMDQPAVVPMVRVENFASYSF